MRDAIALYLGGREISAGAAMGLPLGSLRPTCPVCGELVHLVRRTTGPYFAHWPRTGESPPCPRRVEGGGGGRGSLVSGPPLEERQRESETFREALLAAHGLDDLGDPPSEVAVFLGRIAASLQRARSDGQRTMPGNAVVVVRAAVAADGRYADREAADAQVESVLRLWRHLHLPQVEDDLVFLLRLAERLPSRGGEEPDASEPGADLLAGALLTPALRALAAVPWAGIGEGQGRCATCDDFRPELHRCIECGELVCAGCSTACGWGDCIGRACTDCRRQHRDHHLETGRCPDCGQNMEESDAGIPLRQCWVCNEYVCGDCSSTCESCLEVLCDDCDHDRWHCEGCGEAFCDNNPETEKNLCESCEEPYCDDCAPDDECATCGDGICRSCEEECDVCSQTFCAECTESHHHFAWDLVD